MKFTFIKIWREKYCRARSTHVNRRDSIFTECNFKMKICTQRTPLDFICLLVPSPPPPSSSSTSHAFTLQHRVACFFVCLSLFLHVLGVARYEVPRKIHADTSCSRLWKVLYSARGYMSINVATSDNSISSSRRRLCRTISREQIRSVYGRVFSLVPFSIWPESVCLFASANVLVEMLVRCGHIGFAFSVCARVSECK